AGPIPLSCPAAPYAPVESSNGLVFVPPTSTAGREYTHCHHVAVRSAYLPSPASSLPLLPAHAGDNAANAPAAARPPATRQTTTVLFDIVRPPLTRGPHRPTPDVAQIAPAPSAPSAREVSPSRDRQFNHNDPAEMRRGTRLPIPMAWEAGDFRPFPRASLAR